MDVTKILDQIGQTIGIYGPKIVAALIILIVGIVVAKIVRFGVRKSLIKIGLNRRVAGPSSDLADQLNLEGGIASGMYWLIMLFVLSAVFETLSLTVVTEPINRLLNQIFEYVPRLIGPAVLLLIAWIIAKNLRSIVRQAVDRSSLGTMLSGEKSHDGSAQGGLGVPLGDAVYGLVFLLFLPAILGGLNLGGLLGPVQGMLDKLLGFLPNILAAGIIILVGWFVAKIVRQIVTGILRAAQIDQLGEKMGLAPALGSQGLSGMIGMVLYLLIFIPVLIAGVEALSLEAVSKPVSGMFNVILLAIPGIFAAAIVLGIAYFVSHFLSGLVAQFLSGLGFDGILSKLGFSEEALQGKLLPSAIAGNLLLATIMVFASIEASYLIGFDVLGKLLSELLVFASHIAMGFIIIGVGFYLAQLATKLLASSKSSQAPLIALVFRLCIVLLAGAIGLRQMGLADDIITLAFTFLFGGIAIAATLAFGIGGRDAAGKLANRWLEDFEAPRTKLQGPQE